MTNRQPLGPPTTQADCRWHGIGQGLESPKLLHCSLTRTLVTCDAVEQDGIGLIPLAASTIIHDHLPLHRVWVRLSNV
jgi:hypothetical protein